MLKLKYIDNVYKLYCDGYLIWKGIDLNEIKYFPDSIEF